MKQKSLQLCEDYFSNKIIFDIQDRASAERDGYSEAEIHEDPYFHKYIRPLTRNERMDWGLMFNEDVRSPAPKKIFQLQFIVARVYSLSKTLVLGIVS